MAKDLNKVMIIGRLGTDPEMRYTASGSPVTTFRVASCRQWKDSNGDLREETEWFSVVTWNKLAEICNQHLNKNTRVYLEGRLQTRSWEDQQSGTTRYKTEVVANDMIILETRPSRDHAYAHDDEEIAVPRPIERLDRSVPPDRPGNASSNLSPDMDIGDDDIPF
jgi:single-strand DNA-binding protein